MEVLVRLNIGCNLFLSSCLRVLLAIASIAADAGMKDSSDISWFTSRFCSSDTITL